jgi:transcriptional regulator with GAF, ATPase, and Fis domain
MFDIKGLTLRKIVASASIWVSLISGLLVIILYLVERPLEMIIWVLLVPIIFLLIRTGIYNSQLKEKKDEIKNHYSTYHYIHDSMHAYRSTLSGDEFARLIIEFSIGHINKEEVDKRFVALYYKILCNISNTFRHLLTVECVSNIMTLNETEQFLETWLYCSNATEERMKKRSRLSKNQGLAGSVFSNGTLVEYNNDFTNPEGNFCKVLDNYTDFYTAGMSTPISIEGKGYGVLNVDVKTEQKDVFNDKMKPILALYADLLSATFQNYNFVLSLKK